MHGHKLVFWSVCVCVFMSVYKCASLTLNGCLENSSIKKIKSSKPNEDTSGLVPHWAVSNTSQHTTATRSNTY